MSDSLHSSFLNGIQIRRADAVGIVFVMVMVLMGSFILNQTVLHDFPNSADEHAYLYQAQLFAEGRLSAPAHPRQDFLSPFFILTHHGRVFSIFPPGWPLILSLGVRLGVPSLVNPCLTALTVPIVYLLGLLLFDRRHAWSSIVFLVLSPFLSFNAASYFSHPACLFGVSLVTLFLVLFIKTERWWLAFAAGCAFSATFAIRELTAVLVLSIPIIWVFWRSRSRYRFVLCFTVGAFPFAWLYVWYNAALTGHWFEFIRFLSPSERLGFGPREIRVFDYVEIQTYGIDDAWKNLIRNTGRLFLWTLPGLPLLAMWGFWRVRTNAWIKIFGISVILLPLGYALYPSDGGNQYGPRFYYESLIFLCLFSSYFGTLFLKRTRILVGLVGAGILGGILICSHASYIEWKINQRRAIYRLVERSDLHQAVIFVAASSGDMTQGDLIRNSPDPDSANIIYAWNLGKRNRELIESMPDRTFYLFGRDTRTGFNFLEHYEP